MLRIKLQKLTLHNFMGIEDFTLSPEGDCATVYGQNGTGKTTLKTALHWLLTGKDDEFNSLNPKPLNKDGTPKHNLDTEVAGVFVVDGKIVTLNRLFQEKWTKKRGSNNSTFTGHKESFWVNEVPQPAKNYKETVASLFGGEDSMKALVDPFYVAEKMPWQKRRELLLDMCGTVSDDEIFASEPDLIKLKGLLGDYSLDDFKNILKDKMAHINKQLQTIPARIDELSRLDHVPEGTLPKKELNAKKAALNAEIKQIQASIAPKSADERDIKKDQLRLRLDQLEHERKKKEDSLRLKLMRELDEAYREYSNVFVALTQHQSKVSLRSELEKKQNALRESFKQVAARKFIPSDEAICPMCTQPIPTEMQLEAFNREKSQECADIRERGLELTDHIKKLDAEIEAGAGLREKSDQLSLKNNEAQAALDNMESIPLPDEYTEIIKQLESMIGSELPQDVSAETEKIAALRAEKELIMEDLALYDQAKEVKSRLEALRNEEEVLSNEWAEYEGQKYLVESFIRARVRMLEGKVIDTIDVPGLSVKLFEPQVNGGLRECCQLTYQGVPWDAGLNYGARVFCGLCLISALQKYYKTKMPIFLDNSESITWENPMPGMQIIRLYADNDADKLVQE